MTVRTARSRRLRPSSMLASAPRRKWSARARAGPRTKSPACLTAIAAEITRHLAPDLAGGPVPGPAFEEREAPFPGHGRRRLVPAAGGRGRADALADGPGPGSRA